MRAAFKRASYWAAQEERGLKSVQNAPWSLHATALNATGQYLRAGKDNPPEIRVCLSCSVFAGRRMDDGAAPEWTGTGPQPVGQEPYAAPADARPVKPPRFDPESDLLRAHLTRLPSSFARLFPVCHCQYLLRAHASSVESARTWVSTSPYVHSMHGAC